ncbi:hypothetical protein VP14_014 [Vibrio phage VPMCC14]|nr:hypothetical protein VP14_014 [Vibrio phage VPMCC14]
MNDYTLYELFWLYERIVVREMILDAREKDEKVKEQLTKAHN